MIRVAFPDLGCGGWMGGVVYLYNLLYALSKLEQRRIEPVVIFGRRSDSKVAAMYKPLAELLFTPLMDQKSILWTIHKIQRRILGADPLLWAYLRRHEIDVISHYSSRARNIGDFGAISWIPDFQHLHLPEMFSSEELDRRNSTYRSQIENSDLVIVSSQDALADLCAFEPKHAAKARVLHFVAQPALCSYESTWLTQIETKYNFSGKFFYLPNQFWKHKNHRAVFEAVRILKEKNRDILLLCSGHLEDARNVGHIHELQGFIERHHLGESIRLLGLIDFDDLCFLMRNCISVINPSFFEGWSTTVEEAKSLGKNLILSDIPVHREQNPQGGRYFDPRDPEALAAILSDAWDAGDGGPDHDLELNARNTLAKRTVGFANEYEEIALEAARIATGSRH